LSQSNIVFSFVKKIRNKLASIAFGFVKEKRSLDVIADCLELLEREGAQPFLAYGTALAVFRGNTIIFKHDTDCDLGIRIENWNPAIVQKLINKGYEIIHELGTLQHGYELSIRKNQVKIDLFMFYTSKSRTWNCLWDLPDSATGVRRPIYHTYDHEIIEGRRWVQLEDKKLPVLQNLEKYIVAVYGPDWRIPVLKWDWRTDHHCLDKTFIPDEQR